MCIYCIICQSRNPLYEENSVAGTSKEILKRATTNLAEFFNITEMMNEQQRSYLDVVNQRNRYPNFRAEGEYNFSEKADIVKQSIRSYFFTSFGTIFTFLLEGNTVSNTKYSALYRKQLRGGVPMT